MHDRRCAHHHGFAILISVLIVGAIGAAIATALLLFGAGTARSRITLEQSARAKAFASACTEEALQQIRDATSFTGSATLNWPEGSCTYTVTNQGGSNRTIVVSSTVGVVIRRARAVIDSINPAVRVVTWQEVGEF
jgi:shikimate 5-dehydrogenase